MKQPSKLIEILMKLEGGKSQIKVGDLRQVLKLMKGLSAEEKLVLIKYILG